MDNVKFVIPQKLDDLLHPQEDANVYFVNDELTAREILIKLPECEEHLHNDPLLRCQDFQVFFSVLKNFNTLEPKHVDRVWTLAYKTASAFQVQLRDLFSTAQRASQNLSQHIDEAGGDNAANDLSKASQTSIRASLFDSPQEKLLYCNTLKMLLYIACNFIEHFEDAESSKSRSKAFNDSFSDDTRRKKKRRNESNNKDSFKEYDRYKERAIKCILHLISLPIDRLADSPSSVQEVVNLTTMRVAYKMIENSSFNGMTKSKELVEFVFSILGSGIEKYNQSLSFCLKFIQLLQYKEQLASLLAQLVDFIVKRHKQRLLIGEILREIDRIDVRDLSRDASCPRAVSTFLVELSDKCPEEFVPYLSHLLGYLEQESYLLRNASLNIIGNILINMVVKSQEQNTQDKKLRDELLDCLISHTKDITSYTRSKALSVLCNLMENTCIPLTYLNLVTTAAVSRLSDKSCFVRKNAIKFLVNVIRNNQYSSKLALHRFQSQYELEKVTYDALLKVEEEEAAKQTKTNQDDQKIENGDTNDVSMNTEDDGEDKATNSDDDVDETVDTSMTAVSSQSMQSASISEESPLVLLARKLEYLRGAISLIHLIHKAIPLISELLYSKNVTDIQEAIDFFVACHDSNIDEALVGFKKMILLINSQEKSIKDTISNAYKRIYFESKRYEGKNDKERVGLVVTNLINFVETATIGEVLSLDLLIRHFIETKDFTKAHEHELWARFTMKKPNTTIEERVASIQLLGMLASTNPNVINHNFELCVEHGLVDDGFKEPNCRLIRETCIALQKSLPKKLGLEDRLRLSRLSKNESIFTRLGTILNESIPNLNCEHWYSICDEAVRIIFKMAENPEQICEFIYSQIVGSTLATENVHPVILARFIHFLGDVGLNMAVHLEMDVFFELKIRNNRGEDKEVNQSIRDPNLSVSSRRRSRRFDNANAEDDIGLGGANALEDIEMEFMEGICDEEIVCGDSLLASMAMLILDIARDPIHYSNCELKQSASLALAKYMMVSEKFCSDQLRLLFTILERTKDSEIKINLLVAIGDLCIRFPNLLDGWTQKIFDCLESSDVLVKRTALKVLSRLILSDNIKVKGQISNIANLMVDDDDLLASCSRHFFLELGKKLNAIYNLLPDVISRLSDSEKGVSEDNFRIVMKFLFELIDKDRHIDRLVDKLCHRFTDTVDERHWSDLAYCLSLLKYSDKALGKLFEKFDTFKDKLCIESVHTSIMSIITTFRKTPNIKNDTKQLLDEFEAKVNQAISPNKEGEEDGATANSKSNTNGDDGGDDTEMEVDDEARAGATTATSNRSDSSRNSSRCASK